MKMILLLLATWLTAEAFAQNNQPALSGSITDVAGKNLTGATISLHRSTDSLFLKAELSNESGQFSFREIQSGTYFLIATATGFEDGYSETFTISNASQAQQINFSLKPNSKTLQGVTVQMQKPFVERKIDRTIINVESSISNAGTNALEVLEKSPGIAVDKDGNVTMAGKQSVLIMLDGRPAYLSGTELADMLRNMPSAGLEQIEIMTNPPAKYEAAGNSGVINIKTKKNKTKGFNGNVSNTISYSYVTRTNHSINSNYRNGKVNLFGNYSYNLWQGKSQQHFLRNFKNTSTKQVETIFVQDHEQRNLYNNHNVKLGMDYNLSQKTVTGIVLSGYLSDGNSTGTNVNNLNNANNQTDSMIIAKDKSERYADNLSVNVNLRHLFDSTGKEFTVDADYLTYYRTANQKLSTNYYLPNGDLLKPANLLMGDLPSTVNIYSAKTDFVFPFANGYKLETGLKSSYVTTDNDALYQNKLNDKYETDYGKTNRFIYKENINAAYINLSKQYQKWGMQAGLRAENTNAKGHQVGNIAHEDSVFNKNYVNLFPTLYVSYKADARNTLSANYGRRIDRPAYQDLNPFIYFLDEYTYQVGNTTLQPEFTDNIEVSHSYKGKFTTTLNYSHTSDAFSEVLKQINSERKTFQTKENIATKTNYGIAVNANLRVTPFWYSMIYTNVFNTRFQGPLNGTNLNVNSTGFMANANNQFKMKNGWSAELSGFYRSKMIEGQIIINPMWRADAAIQKLILKDKGSLKFSVRDVFNSQNFSGYVKYDDIDLSIKNTSMNRTFSLAFAYRFGKPLKNQRQRSSGAAEEEKSRIANPGQ